MESKGFSTLELLIAFAVMTLSMTAVILVAFGNQSIALDTELAHRSNYVAARGLEEAGAASVTNFDSILPQTGTDGIYSTELEVHAVSECVRRVTSSAKWTQGLRDLATSLTSVFVSPKNSEALGGDCPTSEPVDGWDNPGIFINENISAQPNPTGIDVTNNFIYLTGEPNQANRDDFYIYEFDAPSISVTQRGSLNTDKTKQIGLTDVDVSGVYAYVASASTSAQFRVIDIDDPNNPVEVYSAKLPGVDPSGSYPEGTAIYYYNDRVYIGTHETSGPEFHVFSVAGLPFAPPQHLGSLELTHNVNDIVVRGNYAYLATSDDDHELMVIDVSNPASMVHPDTTGFGFDAPDKPGIDANDGTAVYTDGLRVYLGRKRDDNKPPDNFFILDPALMIDGAATDDGLLGSIETGLQNTAYISGIRVSGDLAFLSLDDPNVGFIIYNVSDPANIALPAKCSEFNYSENNTGLDMEGDFAFTSNRSMSEIQIIYDQPTACIP